MNNTENERLAREAAKSISDNCSDIHCGSSEGDMFKIILEALTDAKSDLNDTDLTDAELIAELHDILIDFTDDAENGTSGTILSKVKCFKGSRAEDANKRCIATKEADKALAAFNARKAGGE